jgi:TrmH family RNA methyltransferase
MSKTEKITSRDNKKLKDARKTRDRKIPSKVFIEGSRLAEEALRSSLKVVEVFVTKKFEKSERGKVLRAALEAKNAEIHELSDDLFETIADTSHPQGVALICERPKAEKSDLESRIHLDASGLPLVVFLKGTNNPSNLGAILRTAEAAGAAGIIVSRDSADVFSPKALRAAMGSSLRMPLWTGASFDEVMLWAAERRMRTTAADVHGELSYLEVDWKKPRLLIFGSEATGLDERELHSLDEIISIPMKNDVESLNLAVSFGVVLFEGLRSATKPAASGSRA